MSKICTKCKKSKALYKNKSNREHICRPCYDEIDDVTDFILMTTFFGLFDSGFDYDNSDGFDSEGYSDSFDSGGGFD